MPFFDRDGVALYFEESGAGPAILFLHEFGGDHRSWAHQVSHFSAGHRCIVPAARGYPPSDVPDSEDAYGQDISMKDAVSLLDHLGVARAVVVGLSMGAYTALRLALAFPDRVNAVVAASGGAGSFPETRRAFVADAHAMADDILVSGEVPADGFAHGPTCIQLKRKDEAAWREFRDHLAEHPALGSAMTLRKVQAGRPSLYDFRNDFRTLGVPVLLLVGDEDDPCLDVNLFLKRNIPGAGLAVFPKSGHLLNLEDPDRFNRVLEEFLAAVEHGDWPAREIADSPFAGVGVSRG